MAEIKYAVLMNNEYVAENLTLDIATILVKAIFETYWAMPGLTISITRQDVAEGQGEDDE